MHDLLNRRVRISESATPTGSNGPVVLTTTGDKFILTPANPITLMRWGIIVNAAKDASALVLTAALRPTAGSDTNRAVQDTLTDSATARAAGVVLERRIAGTNPNASTGSDGSLVNVAPLATGVPGGAGIDVLPGQELVLAVTTAAASTGGGYLFVDFIEYASVAQYAALTSTSVNYTVVQL